jgi:hypothetical protein
MTRFSTVAFERSHGKAPRGRGSWMFCPVDRWSSNDYLEAVFTAPPHSTLREAKAAAAAHFPAGSELVVCP